MLRVLVATLLLLLAPHGCAIAARARHSLLWQLRGGGADGTRPLAAKTVACPPKAPVPAPAAATHRTRDDLGADLRAELARVRGQLRATLGVCLAVTNPIKWVSQRLVRMAATSAYIRWYVDHHVKWERIGERLRVSRLRFLQHSLRPDEAWIRPPVLLERLLAAVDFLLVPWVVHTSSERQLRRRRGHGQGDFHTDLGEAAPAVATAVLTSAYWALRVALHPWDRAAAVLRLFGETPLERRAAALTKEETARRLRSRALRLGCDARSALGLLLRVALVRLWVRPDAETLSAAYWERVVTAGYTVPAVAGGATLACAVCLLVAIVVAV